MYRSGPVYLSRRVDCHVPRDQLHIILWSEDPDYFVHGVGSSWHSWDGFVIWNVYNRRHHLLRLAAVVLTFAVIVSVYRNRRSIATCWHNQFSRRSGR